MEEILRLFPEKIKQAVERIITNRWNRLQEIRFRLNQPIEVLFDQGHIEWISTVTPVHGDYMFLLNQLSSFSLYRLEDELREGYITIEGGHRVGLAGKVNTKNGSVKAIQHITFLNIRIAKEKIGVGKPILPYIYDQSYCNTLFVGPPQTGKTTLLRDVVRIIASGWGQVPARKVGVIDERSEIGGSIKGVPQHDLGFRTDVMDACPKAEGMMMMIRSMSPDILVADEIGSTRDVQALMEATNAGVTVFCTIHGQDVDELKKRPSLQPLFEQNVFQRFIVLENHIQPGHIQGIADQKGRNILQKSGCMPDEVDRRTTFHRHNNLDWV